MSVQQFVKTKNLPKTDLIGKSDPYAEVALGDQVYKTPTVKNSQNPEWNFGTDFDLDGNQPTDVELNVFAQDKLPGLQVAFALVAYDGKFEM